MLQYLAKLPEVLKVLSPAAVLFLTPTRAFGLLAVFSEIGQAITAKYQNAPLDVQAKETREALEAPLKLFFREIKGYEEEKAEVEAALIPWLMSMIYGNPKDAIESKPNENENA